MRHFKDGDELVLEPWRAAAFPLVKDLVVDRARIRPDYRGRRLHFGFDRQRAGRECDSGSEGSGRPVRWMPRLASGAAPAWRLARMPSAALFTGAKIAHLGLLPQGQPERDMRAIRMVAQVNDEMFGKCTNIGECTRRVSEIDPARSDRPHEPRLHRRLVY